MSEGRAGEKDWVSLLRKLGRGGEGPLGLTPLAGDASDRRYYRLTHGRNSYVIMELPRPHTGELSFINMHGYLYKGAVPVPEILHYDQKGGLMLLEDLGDLSLESRLEKTTKEEKLDLYRKAIDILLDIQGLPIDNDCVAAGLSFDEEKLLWELNFMKEHMIKGFLGQKLSGALEKELEAEFVKLCRPLANAERVLNHRDYHSRNIMVKEGRLRIIDFQDARMGPCQYDLASLLRDSYVVLEEELMEELLLYYVQKKEEREGRDMDLEPFKQLFHWMSLQRNLKAIGTFAFQKVVKGKDNYMDSIPVTLRYVERNLGRYPRLARLASLLRETLLEPHLSRMSG